MPDRKELVLCLIILILAINSQILALRAVVGGQFEPEAIPAGGSGEIHINYIFPEGMHQILQEEYFFFEVEDKAGFTFGDLIYPPGEVEDDGFIHLYDQAVLIRPVNISHDIEPGTYQFSVLAAYQLCYDTGACIMPDEEEFELTLEVLPPETIPPSDPILIYLLFALLGGIILNLTPCVLPVLSLRAFTLIKDSQADKKKITLNSLSYCLGILFCFAILAIVIILLKASGEFVGWGFQFQNPIFVLVLTSVIFVFSLSLFDVFVITGPESKVAGKVTSKRGLAGSFSLGVFAVLLGTPCTAPILGAALAFAFAQPPLVILGMFGMIGLGMALPFIVIAFRPSFVNKLPKPGEWMNVLKEIMGFLLLFWAVKMLEVLYYHIGGEALISVIFFLLALALAFRIIGRFVRPDASVAKKISALILAALIVILVGNHTLRFNAYEYREDMDVQILEGRWQPFSPERIHELREEGVPVFIDFTAKWCTTCYTNEITVLYASDIQRAFEERGVELFIADFTRYDETIFEWIQSYGRVGVPVYVFYLPGEEEPVLLPEIITKRMIFDVLERLD